MSDFPHSLREFQSRFPDEAACVRYLFAARWPEGLSAPLAARAKPGRCKPRHGPRLSTGQALGMRPLRQADIGDCRHHYAPLQAAADPVVLDRLPDGHPFQRHLGAATATPARPRLLQIGLAVVCQTAAAWWPATVAPWPGSSKSTK